MKKLQLLLSIIFILSFAVSLTFAGDFANLKFIGFSQDGNYVAFEEWGEFDGIGGNYAKTYIVDTVNNTFAVKPFIYEAYSDRTTESSAKILKQKYRLAAANGLRQFKIVQGNTGNLILSHLLTDWTFDDNFTTGGSGEKVKFNDYMNQNSPNQYEFYELKLETFEDKTVECTNRTGLGVFKLGLTLNYTSHESSSSWSQILQKDSVLPTRRNCPYSYRIESVYFYEDKILVFLNIFSHGFEGPDMRYMVVTAQMDYEPVTYSDRAYLPKY